MSREQPRTQVGNIQVTALCAGLIRMDGGAMFGVVPSPLWSRMIEPDHRNRIELPLWCLLVETDDETILVETGFGGKVNERQREIYDLRESPGLIGELEIAGKQPEDIDRVIVTHLHQDHAGGCTLSEGKGYAPAFPNARYVVQASEWRDALEADGQTANAYRVEEVLHPLEKAGLVDFVDGDTRLVEGLRLILTPGHTRAHQSVMIESGDDRLLFVGDLVPTASHLKPIYVMAYDLYPRETYFNKIRFLERAAAEGWWVAWPHDPELVWGRVRADERNDFAVLEGVEKAG